MQFKRGNEIVLARKLFEPIQIEGETLAVPGDYLVAGENGQNVLWPAKAFEDTHEPIARAVEQP